MLETLGRRLNQGDFPHEVGLFLGYPPEDVEGFRLHRGRDYKLAGCWKVYSDVERARQCFRRYGLCRAALCRRLREGKALARCSGWRKFICDRRRCGAYRYQLFNPMSYGGYAR